MSTAQPDLSRENLDRLIGAMPEWSRKQPWNREQVAAWRLRWFGLTPEDDAIRRESYRDMRVSSREEREPFTDWPNNMGTYD